MDDSKEGEGVEEVVEVNCRGEVGRRWFGVELFWETGLVVVKKIVGRGETSG